jgi:hypothetical protein
MPGNKIYPHLSLLIPQPGKAREERKGGYIQVFHNRKSINPSLSQEKMKIFEEIEKKKSTRPIPLHQKV